MKYLLPNGLITHIKIAKNGYAYIYLNRQEGKPHYFLLHRYIMQYSLGRKLKKGEIIHHRDGDPLNNKLENLELVKSHSKHLSDHQSERLKKIINCGYCGNHFHPKKLLNKKIIQRFCQPLCKKRYWWAR